VVGGVFVGEHFGEGGQAGAEHAGGGEQRLGLEGGVGRDVDDRPAALLAHDGRDQPGDADHVQQVVFHAQVPVGVGNVQQLALGAVPGAVDHRVDAAPALHGAVDQPGDV